MRRSSGLIPLSHLHKTKLTYALHLRRAGTADAVITPARAWSAFLNFWDMHGAKHMEEEEEILLPCLGRRHPGGPEVPEAAEILKQHEEIRQMVRTMAGVPPAPAGRDNAGEQEHAGGAEASAPKAASGMGTPESAALRKLGELITDHVRYEERVFFPLVQRCVPEKELEGLGEQFSPPVACTIKTD